MPHKPPPTWNGRWRGRKPTTPRTPTWTPRWSGCALPRT